MTDLTIATYNCKFFDTDTSPDKLLYMNDVFSKCDYLCIQEHWLYESQFHRFDSLSSDDVVYCSVSAMDPDIQRSGRPHGGTAIIWRRNVSYKTEVIDTCSARLCAIKIYINDDSFMLLFNVYMPTDQRCDGFNLCVTQDVLSEVSAICQAHDATYVVVTGDLNTDFGRDTLQTRELKQFCDSESLLPCIDSDLARINYTFENSAGYRSIIDHCLVSQNIVGFLKSYFDYDSINNSSDHVCVFAKFQIECHYAVHRPVQTDRKVLWYKASINDIDAYKLAVVEKLDSIVLPSEALDCKLLDCKKHKNDLEHLHDLLIDVCLSAGRKVLPKSKAKSTHKRVVPGWGEYVDYKKKLALTYHQMWKDAGRPNCGELFNLRKQTRADYHYAIRKVKQKENVIRSEKMSNSLLCNDSKKFWYDVKKMKGNKNIVPLTVDDVRGDKNIANLFADKYGELYTSVESDKHSLNDIKNCINCRVDAMNDKDIRDCMFKMNDLLNAIKCVSKGKSDGQSGLFSDHIIHCPDQFFVTLLRLYNSMLVHGVSPSRLKSSWLIPIPKNKRLQCNNSDNFRAICLQSVLCKVLDVMVLNRECLSLATSELQFGFKKKHSAALATAVVLETVDYYNSGGSNVFGVALDASKAFDRIEYACLFNTLLQRGMSPLCIRLLFELYTEQEMKVRYNSVVSDSFVPTNGVKQGGVLSPTLFSVYMDGLIDELQKSGTGCYVGRKFCGIVSYADDVMLLAPTQYAMNRMLDICDRYAKKVKVKFNGTKSKAMVFAKHSTEVVPRFVIGGEVIECVPDMLYLGHKIIANRSDSHTKPVVTDFNRKFNAFIGDFDVLNSEVKISLFQKYCSSLYSSYFCDFTSKDFEKICVAWRKALRRTLKVSNITHCNLLPAISGIWPVEGIIHKRFVNFYFNGLHHNNSIVNFIFKCSTSCKRDSRIGANLLHIWLKYGINVNIGYCDKPGSAIVSINAFYNNVNEATLRTGSQIRELLHVRDNQAANQWLLDLCQINDIIYFLCTS